MLVGLVWLAGCASYRPANAPLENLDPTYGYRPVAAAEQRPIGDAMILLAFSGGGTRAAALAYGVLQELRDTPIGGAEPRRLLDEVDSISSVSGGSFTAAYYGLFGDRIFQDFETRFLRRDIQGRILWELVRPLNWIRMASTFFDRTELAIRLYDREIFDRATFADLKEARGPFVQINATDLSQGNRFTFFQPQFDLLCSDLTPLQVARAVAASSAVPVLFNPITLRNYAGTCGLERPAWIERAFAERRKSPRRYREAAVFASYLEPKKRKYVHLVDGGISDNLGLRAPLDNVILSGGLFERMKQLGVTERYPRRLAVIVVNAEVHPESKFDLSAASPGLASIVNSVSGVQIYRYNFETLELMRESMNSWVRELPPDAEGRRTEARLVEVSFDSLEDEAERKFFNDLPTSFSLSEEAVDRLIEVGRRLLRESEDYQELVTALGGAG
jgi:NTE family protein